MSELPEGWGETKLEENITDIAMGPFGSNLKVDSFVDAGVPVIKGGNLSGYFVGGSFSYVSKEKADSLKRSIAYPGDIIITHRGTLGQVSLVPVGKYPRYVTSQSQLRFTIDDKKIDGKYLLYFLKSRVGQYELLTNASQVGVPAIATPTKAIKAIKAIKNVNLLLPSLTEQKAIAKLLSSFDEKIELLRTQNKTLEILAQTIFKEWFCVFNYPNATGEMVGSELGEIPKGWRIGKLGEEFDITMGQSPKGDTYNENEDGIVFYQGRAEFQNRFPKRRLYTTDPKRIANAFDVLMSVRAPVGDINVASEKCCIGRGLSAINSSYKSYALYKMKSLNRKFDQFESAGTVFGSINKASLENIEVIIPPQIIIEQYDSIASTIDEKIFNNFNQVKTLSKTRDTLLPKLMSGESRVSL